MTPRDGLHRTASVDSSSSGPLEEYKYLNDLTQLRIKTVHLIWLGSLAAHGTIVGIALQKSSMPLALGSLVVMVPFILSMAYQLDSICRIRSYVAVFLAPELGIHFDSEWPNTVTPPSGMKIVRMSGVPWILLMPYAFSYVVLAVVMAPWSSFSHGLMWAAAAVLLCWSGKVLTWSFAPIHIFNYIREWEVRRSKIGDARESGIQSKAFGATSGTSSSVTPAG